MGISFHINFNGQCKDAFEYYAQKLDGKIGTMLQFKDSPVSSSVAESRKNEVVHANICIEGVEFSGADLDSKLYEKPRGFYVLLSVNTEEKVKYIFSALEVGGEVILAPQKTFWSTCYGILIDRFGVPWKINCGA